MILRAWKSHGVEKRQPWMFAVRPTGRVMSKYFNVCFKQNNGFFKRKMRILDVQTTLVALRE